MGAIKFADHRNDEGYEGYSFGIIVTKETARIAFRIGIPWHGEGIAS